MPDLDLWVKLNDVEIREKADELSSLMLEYDSIEEEKRAATKEFNDDLKELRANMRAVSKAIREGCEQRPVPCEIRFHSPVVGSKQTVRLDTNEVVSQEEMTGEERQDNLFGEMQEWGKIFPPDAGAEPELEYENTQQLRGHLTESGFHRTTP